MAAVTITPAATPSTAAGKEGTTSAAPHATAAVSAPIRAPTTGKSARPRRRSRSPTSVLRPIGTAVRNVTAATADRIPSRTADARRLEGRHVRQDRDRRANQWQRERGAGPLTEPEPEIEQRLETEPLEDERVPRLR